MTGFNFYVSYYDLFEIMHVHHFAAIVAVPFCTGIWTLLTVGLLEGFSLGLSNAGAFNKYSLKF